MIRDTKRVLVEAWALWARAYAGAFVVKEAALEGTCGGISVPLMNMAIVRSDGEISKAEWARLTEAFAAELRPRGVAGLLGARTNQVDLPEGATPLFEMPGMVAGAFLPARNLQAEHDIREVKGAEMAAKISELNAAAHHMTEADAKAMTEVALWKAPNHGFLLYAEGEAVAAGSSTFVEGANYVGWMATREDCRGRGYAEAVLRHMDAFMRKEYGVKESVLHATEMGRPVYERVGFRVVDRYTYFLVG